ncbi:MAG: DUF1592 domain-containing protein [Verrucomicrobiota bacterium]|jgi:hypothetical protein|nr:DUF1592 domain-containing protein [Verrucomicrobiota bacterium]MDP7442361.1 DUF1592 domain-containing protein [Verrucomicrobiota bacterium]|tara:strand:+ start:54 stop:2651 length:2598 start_codon:yes stop_codon:yes gene_type:complete
MVCLFLAGLARPLGMWAAERSAEGLVVLYDFRLAKGNIVKDRSGKGQPLDLKIENPQNVHRSNGILEVHGKTLIRSDKPAAKVFKAVRRSGEITIEAWVRPANTRQDGPARMVTLSGSSSERNFTLGQEGDKVEVRLRTTKTSGNGIPSLSTRTRSLAPRLTHVVYTRNRGARARLYINGKLQLEERVAGAMTNWNGKYRLGLANEISSDRPWLGAFHLVAIYSRDLSAGEVTQHYKAGVNAHSVGAQLATRNHSPKEKFFNEEIAPLLSRHCLECHDTVNHNGKLDLSKKSTAFATTKKEIVIVPGKSAESLLWEVVEADDMPDERDLLNADEKKLLRKWIDDGAVWIGEEIDPLAHTYDRRSNQNWVRRLTVSEYIETVRSLTGVDIVKEAREILPPDIRADGFSNTAYNLFVDLKHIEAYSRLAGIIVAKMNVRQFARRFSKKQGFTDVVMRDLVAKMGKWFLRGPLEEHEVAAFRGISSTVAAAGGTFEEALELLVEAMLQSPRFLYRVENERGDGTAWPVNEYELASRMSYIIWGAPPDIELLKAAENGQLFEDVGLEAQLQRMLGDPRAAKRSSEFIHEWLNLDRLANMKPNPEKFPKWNAALARDMRAETIAFFDDVIWKQNRPLADLLNAKLTYATPRLARHYALPVQGEGLTRYDLNLVPERGGLLTQGSVLTIGGDEASMVTRGLFVLRNLLRSGVNDPPSSLNAEPVASKSGLTQRNIAKERIADKTCGGCHIKFEPLAFGLEKFDGIGAFHEEDEHGNTLRDDGKILFPGTAKPVPYRSSAELMDLLAESERVQQCLTWKVAQFALGRPISPTDSRILDDVYRASQKGGGTYASLMRAIIKSDLVQKTQTEAN